MINKRRTLPDISRETPRPSFPSLKKNESRLAPRAFVNNDRVPVGGSVSFTVRSPSTGSRTPVVVSVSTDRDGEVGLRSPSPPTPDPEVARGFVLDAWEGIQTSRNPSPTSPHRQG